MIGLCPVAFGDDFDLEVLTGCGRGGLFDSEGVGWWIEFEGIIVEDGGYRHH